MSKQKVTIHDLAFRLNLSVSTISRALRGNYDVRVATRERVLELARELNYVPNPIAQNLRKNKTKTIGVVIPEIVHHFYSSAINGMQSVVNKKGYHLFIAQSNETLKQEQEVCEILMANRVDGLIIALSRETDQYEHIENYIRQGTPVILFDRVSDKIDTTKVKTDDFEGAYKLTEHLLKTGKKRIAHLAGPESISIGKERLEGYLAALKANHIKIDNELIITNNLTIEMGKKNTISLLNLASPPDAIFAVVDMVANGARLAIKEKGLSIPKEISLACFTNADDPITSLVEPPITAILQKGFELGEEAAKQFFKQEQKKTVFKSITKVIKTELIIRQSTLPDS